MVAFQSCSFFWRTLYIMFFFSQVGLHHDRKVSHCDVVRYWRTALRPSFRQRRGGLTTLRHSVSYFRPGNGGMNYVMGSVKFVFTSLNRGFGGFEHLMGTLKDFSRIYGDD